MRTREVSLLHESCDVLTLSCTHCRLTLWDEWETYFIYAPRNYRPTFIETYWMWFVKIRLYISREVQSRNAIQWLIHGWLAKWHKWAELILQPLRCFTYVTAHSPTLPSLYLRHSSFCNPYFTSPTSQAHSPTFPSLHLCQLILQPFRRFTYVTAHWPALPFLHLRHSSFSNPYFASPTSQALHLRHLASRPWINHLVTFLSWNFSIFSCIFRRFTLLLVVVV